MDPKRSDRPNMLGAAVFAFILGAIMLGLSAHAKLTGHEVETNAVLMGAALLILSALAYEKHVELRAMTPEARHRYWRQKDEEFGKTADSYARSMLGRDYDKK